MVVISPDCDGWNSRIATSRQETISEDVVRDGTVVLR
jgi:hypothetical protein